MCLEFSKVTVPVVEDLYDFYSFQVLLVRAVVV